MAQPDGHRPPLTVDRIVDAACVVVARDGLEGLSMRRLGAELGADPMAMYHHVPNKRELLRLVTARTIGSMPVPDPAAPWDDQVRQWATSYWDLVVANRALTFAGLADPGVAAGGLPSTEPLVAAIGSSGVPKDAVEPIAYLVVDAVHGSALAVAPTRTHGHPGDDGFRASFLLGLDVIVAGIRATATVSRTSRGSSRSRRA